MMKCYALLQISYYFPNWQTFTSGFGKLLLLVLASFCFCIWQDFTSGFGLINTTQPARSEWLLDGTTLAISPDNDVAFPVGDSMWGKLELYATATTGTQTWTSQYFASSPADNDPVLAFRNDLFNGLV